MPTVAIVDGVKIEFYPNDHPPPHFMSYLRSIGASFIGSRSLTRGTLPRAKLAIVLD